VGFDARAHTERVKMIKHILMMITMANLRYRQRGLTTVEYAVAGAILVAAIVLAFIALGGGIGGTVDTIVEEMGQ
jgi:Flp pilus assembly pilin Flp